MGGGKTAGVEKHEGCEITSRHGTISNFPANSNFSKWPFVAVRGTLAD